MTSGLSDSSAWPLSRLISQRKHLEAILAVSAGQGDPQRPQMRAELEAVRAELTRRSTCPACLDGRHGECEDPCKCPCPAPAGEKKWVVEEDTVRGRDGEPMDSFQVRSAKNLKRRYEDQIRQNAERIREHIGFVIQRLDRGQAASVEYYVHGIESAAHDIRAHVAALEALEQALGILETGDDPS